MQIENHNTEKIGYFKASQNGMEAGLMTYHWAGASKMVIEHTEVDPDFSGKGVGKKLVMAAVDYAREHNIKIQPLCPFAKSVFDKTAEIQDVLF